jgi:hypothetical protein
MRFRSWEGIAAFNLHGDRTEGIEKLALVTLEIGESPPSAPKPYAYE